MTYWRNASYLFIPCYILEDDIDFDAQYHIDLNELYWSARESSRRKQHFAQRKYLSSNQLAEGRAVLPLQ